LIRRGMFTRRSFVHHLVLDISRWNTLNLIWLTPVFDLKVDVPEFAVDLNLYFQLFSGHYRFLMEKTHRTEYLLYE
jgi:hypothetical protein